MGEAKFKTLSLFAGIGGFDLGLERTGGFETVAFCEIDPFCQRVLAKHWPGVPCYDDVRSLTAEQVGDVDCIVGGFPCQDISTAGLGAGIDGKRSGLWSEFSRLIGELRPRFVIVENVSALLARGIDRVLGDLASLGYDADWHCIPAAYVGAPHRRDRVWIVAYAGDAGSSCTGRLPQRRGPIVEPGDCNSKNAAQVADATSVGWGSRGTWRALASGEVREAARPTLAYADGERGCSWPARSEDAEDARQSPGRSQFGQWDIEPDVGRVANGVPSRVDRLRCLGNAVVPQIPELIGRAILAAEAA